MERRDLSRAEQASPLNGGPKNKAHGDRPWASTTKKLPLLLYAPFVAFVVPFFVLCLAVILFILV